MLPCICSVIDHRWTQNVVRTKRGAHKPQPGVSLMFLSQFYVICDLLWNRPMETRYLFDNSVMSWHNSAYYTYAGGFHTVMYSSCLSNNGIMASSSRRGDGQRISVGGLLSGSKARFLSGNLCCSWNRCNWWPLDLIFDVSFCSFTKLLF